MKSRFEVSPAATDRPTWRSDVVSVLGAEQQGITYQGLLVKVIDRHPDRPRSDGDKGFYHAMRRLLKSGAVTRASNGLLYSAKLLKEMTERGEALPAPKAEHGGSPAIVVRILKDFPKGLPGPELGQKAAQQPDAPASMRTHKHYIYNVLGKLRADGVVMKDGHNYRLASSGQVVH